MAQAKQNGTEPSPEELERKRVRRISRARADGGDPDLEWLLECSAAELGERGTLAGVVRQCESGSVGGSTTLGEDGSYVHLYTDEQLGLDNHDGTVERFRWLMDAWLRGGPCTMFVLVKRYAAPKAEFRADEGYGATVRHVEGSDHRPGEHNIQRTGVWAHLGPLAGLAFELCDDPGKLLTACREPRPMRKGKINANETKRRARVVESALQRAVQVDHAAHVAWFEAKAAAVRMRTAAERRHGVERVRAPTPMTVNAKAEAVVRGLLPIRVREAVTTAPAAKPAKWQNPALIGSGFIWDPQTASEAHELRLRTLSVQTRLSFDTVARVYAGKGSERSWRRVTTAAANLGFPPPPDLDESELKRHIGNEALGELTAANLTGAPE